MGYTIITPSQLNLDEISSIEGSEDLKPNNRFQDAEGVSPFQRAQEREIHDDDGDDDDELVMEASTTSSMKMEGFAFGVYKGEPVKSIQPDVKRIAKEKLISEAKKEAAKGNWNPRHFGRLSQLVRNANKSDKLRKFLPKETMEVYNPAAKED